MMDRNEFDDEVLFGAEQLLGEGFRVAIEQYLEDAATFLSALDVALKKDNFAEVGYNSLALQNSSSQIGAVKLCDIARQIEYLSGRDGVDVKVITELFDDAKVAFEKVRSKLSCYA